MGTRIRVQTPLARILAARTGDWLVAHVEAWHERSDRHRSDPGWFHPSGLNSPCDARLAFDFIGVTVRSTLTARRLRIFDNGHARDRDWKDYLKRSGLSIIKRADDRRVELGDIRVRGEVDDLVVNPLTGERCVFEFKTMNAAQWKMLRAPLEGHVIQVHPYMVGLDARLAYVLYENKDTQELKPYIVRFDAALWETICHRVLGIRDALERGELPLRTPLRNDSECGYHHCCAGYMLTEEVVDSVRRYRGS